jgi:threonine dehydratase
MLSIADVLQARERIRDAIYLSPCAKSDHFERAAGCRAVYCKLENLQRTGSFKERGALNKMATLSTEERKRGVITASAGNHAQGVAYHSQRLGIDAVIVMPEQTPLVKVMSTKGYGARVVLHGANFDDACQMALKLQADDQRVFIHPFDDPLVMAGQGTIGLELLEQSPELDMAIVPVGGGGLIAGIAVAMKEQNPKIRVIGVEAQVLAKMKQSLTAGHPLKLEPASTLADGVAVRRPGDKTFEVVKRYVDDLVSVDEEEIANAILLLLEREKTVVEGAGALTMAALINGKIPTAKGLSVALVLSGGNVDVNVLSRVIERGLAKDGRLARLHVRLPDRPGALAKFVTVIGERGANIVEIHHHRTFSGTALGDVRVEVTLETRGRDHLEELIAALGVKGWSAHIHQADGH